MAALIRFGSKIFDLEIIAWIDFAAVQLAVHGAPEPCIFTLVDADAADARSKFPQVSMLPYMKTFGSKVFNLNLLLWVDLSALDVVEIATQDGTADTWKLLKSDVDGQAALAYFGGL